MRIAIIGDIHDLWGEPDLSHFRPEHWDLVLFVGDLPGFGHGSTESVARGIARLDTPAILVPGNHDGTSPLQVLAEATRMGCGFSMWGTVQARAVARLRDALGTVQLGGYSVHPCAEVDILVGRPHAMDGRHLSFQPYLRQAFDITDRSSSAARLRHCVDRCTQPIVFLSHNGPSGLGDTRDDLYGRTGPEMDNGDPDLAEAIAYARASGHRVLACVSGHMHHTGDGGMRRWTTEQEGIRYVNAARVPRVFERGGRSYRHCVELTVQEHSVHVREILY